MALQEDLPAKPEDKTVPKYRQIDKRIGQEAIQWGAQLEAEYKQYLADNPDAAPVNAKRSIPGQGASSRAGDTKKVKTEPGQAVDEGEMRKLVNGDKVSSLTVAQLKDFCTVKGLAVTGKKADLVERIVGWFESR